ncbi:DUF5132 domain-containing protein [Baaleninema sp.]|uniref:DUF5132 domain-containing protein n=1 Tax=Baaleninema sp. TaxID=3101197 RepID=UPI003D006860
MKFDLDLNDFVEDIGLPGVVFGVGVLVLTPFFGSALAKVGKPFAKATIKGGLVVYDKGKVVFSEAREAFGQMVKESRAEMENYGNNAIDSVKTVSIHSTPVEE